MSQSGYYPLFLFLLGVAQFPGVVSPTSTSAQTIAAVPKRPEPAVILPQNEPSSAALAEPMSSPHRDPEVDPIDAAAHLQLLGESLSLIGRRLQETEVRHSCSRFWWYFRISLFIIRY